MTEATASAGAPSPAKWIGKLPLAQRKKSPWRSTTVDIPDVMTAAFQASACHTCLSPLCSPSEDSKEASKIAAALKIEGELDTGGCPIQRSIPKVNRAVFSAALNAGDPDRLLDIAHKGFEMGGKDWSSLFTGPVCPKDLLCQKACVREITGHGAVTIGAIENFIAVTAMKQGWYEPPTPRHGENGKTVSIIGSGPAGLAAADRLRSAGFEVHIYERQDRAGGLLMYGIPPFKLEKDRVQFVVDLLQRGGIHIHTNCEVVGDKAGPGQVSFHQLRQQGPVIVATGLYNTRALEIPGADLPQVQKPIDFLSASTRRFVFGEHVPTFENGTLNAHGRLVVVAGGGDTATDCSRTSVDFRQGAAKVHKIYRRGEKDMPGSPSEFAEAKMEGVAHSFYNTPKEIVWRSDRGVDVVFDRMERDGNRIRNTGDTFRIENVGLVLPALGFMAEPLRENFSASALKTRNGDGRLLLSNDRTFETHIPGVYGAGDIVGTGLVVQAIANARNVADAIIAQVPRDLSPRERDLAAMIRHMEQREAFRSTAG